MVGKMAEDSDRKGGTLEKKLTPRPPVCATTAMSDARSKYVEGHHIFLAVKP